jgi:hypothetical protein
MLRTNSTDNLAPLYRRSFASFASLVPFVANAPDLYRRLIDVRPFVTYARWFRLADLQAGLGPGGARVLDYAGEPLLVLRDAETQTLYFVHLCATDTPSWLSATTEWACWAVGGIEVCAYKVRGAYHVSCGPDDPLDLPPFRFPLKNVLLL